MTPAWLSTSFHESWSKKLRLCLHPHSQWHRMAVPSLSHTDIHIQGSRTSSLLVSETFQRDSSPLGKPIYIPIFWFHSFPNKSSSDFLQWSRPTFWEHSGQTYCLLDTELDIYASDIQTLAYRVPQRQHILEEIEVGKMNQRSKPLKYENTRLYWLKSSCPQNTQVKMIKQDREDPHTCTTNSILATHPPWISFPMTSIYWGPCATFPSCVQLHSYKPYNRYFCLPICPVS